MIPEFNFDGMTAIIAYKIVFAFGIALLCLYLHEKKKQLKWKKLSNFVKIEVKKRKDNIIKFRKPED